MLDRIRQANWYSIVAIVLTVIGVIVTAAGFFAMDPFMELFGIAIIVSGAVSALVGLH